MNTKGFLLTLLLLSLILVVTIMYIPYSIKMAQEGDYTSLIAVIVTLLFFYKFVKTK